MLNTKLELTDSLQDVITKLSEGNPGAINFLFEIIKLSRIVHPDTGGCHVIDKSCSVGPDDG